MIVRRAWWLGVAAVLAAWAAPTAARGCPFCDVVGESLAQRRDRATVVAVGEAAGPVVVDASGLQAQPFALLQAIRGGLPAGPVTARIAAPVAGTAVVFGAPADGAGVVRWSAVAADEPLIAHVANAPATHEPAAARLAWFRPRLEHADPAIAADAFAEFGLAPFAAVREVAGGFDGAKLAAWLEDPGVDQRRRGFYGLALGIVAATDQTSRAAAVAALRAAVEAPADDFRAGFDGILGGLLVAEGPEGLDRIERAGLLAPTARPADQRHVLAALRFAWEYLADSIPRRRVAAATARLLAAPAVAADATVDLAREEHWEAVDAVAALWESLGADDPLVRRAVAGYLAACPLPAARSHLERIRSRDAERLEAALAASALPPG